MQMTWIWSIMGCFAIREAYDYWAALIKSIFAMAVLNLVYLPCNYIFFGATSFWSCWSSGSCTAIRSRDSFDGFSVLAKKGTNRKVCFHAVRRFFR